MGQGASKAVSRIVSSGSKTPHIPSVPGKSGPIGTVAPDPFSGFTRGGQGGTQREEAQRQFLQSQQTTGSDPSSVYSDKLPDDLIKFMTDVGPLRTNKDETATIGAKKLRIPRVSGSLFAPNLDDNEAEERTVTKSRSPAHDKTRRTESMRLAENIAGIETTRTTSFSHKHDAIDPNENAGLDVVQLYSLLTNKSTAELFCTENAANTAELRVLLTQSMKFLQVPVLMKDSDDSYVGAWPEKAEGIIKAHRGMELVPKYRAKLVLEDLWESEQSVVLEAAPAPPK